jgi:tetratricopeptide (TPR) repeat protein
MKPICRACLFLLSLTGLAWTTASACTIITMARGKKVWIGNNEDWTDPRTKMWIVPASPGEYGRVVFGFENRFIQGGINERGLFLDANALQPPGWKPDPAKPLFEDSFDKQIGDYILAHCARVADAITFFKTYSVFLDGGKFVIADAVGESITVEWAEGQDRITRRDGTYQISSNIPQWNIVPGKVDDPRYNIAEKVILSRNDVSLDTVRAVLSATHKEWAYPTIYSYICDLESLTVYLYNFHNFEEAYVFNLRTELSKAPREYDIPSLFAVKTFAALTHDTNAPKLGVHEVQEILAKEGVDAAFDWYQSVKDGRRDLPNYAFSDAIFQQLGKDLLGRNKTQEALDVFRFATLAFPDSADSWELQGDAWLKAGDATQAKASYERALQLNPENSRLRDKLKGLHGRA